ncbi:MAG TPA: hypothetical protein EYP34_06615 [Chromatiaceae bacterium]|nr:hypothetical protein [Chromatiaceae bacterium]
MSDFILHEGTFISPTPAGAYYASASPTQDPARRVLWQLLQLDNTPSLTLAKLQAWTGEDEQHAQQLLYHLQTETLVQGFEQPQTCPGGPLEEVLPQILPAMSGDGKALLADDQGFYVASAGFRHEAAEELAALSASLGTLHKRHKPLLSNNLGYHTSAWTLADAAGNSQIGFWPLFIGDQRFSLVVGGLPRLNQHTFTQLVWVLGIRYGC